MIRISAGMPIRDARLGISALPADGEGWIVDKALLKSESAGSSLDEGSSSICRDLWTSSFIIVSGVERLPLICANRPLASSASSGACKLPLRAGITALLEIGRGGAVSPMNSETTEHEAGDACTEALHWFRTLRLKVLVVFLLNIADGILNISDCFEGAANGLKLEFLWQNWFLSRRRNLSCLTQRLWPYVIGLSLASCENSAANHSELVLSVTHSASSIAN